MTSFEHTKITMAREDRKRLRSLIPPDWTLGEFVAILLSDTSIIPSEDLPDPVRDSFLLPAGSVRPMADLEPGRRIRSSLRSYGTATAGSSSNPRRTEVGLVEYPEVVALAWAAEAIRTRQTISSLQSVWLERALRKVDLSLSNGLSLSVREYGSRADADLYARVQSKARSLGIDFRTLLRLYLSQEKPA